LWFIFQFVWLVLLLQLLPFTCHRPKLGQKITGKRGWHKHHPRHVSKPDLDYRGVGGMEAKIPLAPGPVPGARTWAVFIIPRSKNRKYWSNPTWKLWMATMYCCLSLRVGPLFDQKDRRKCIFCFQQYYNENNQYFPIYIPWIRM